MTEQQLKVHNLQTKKTVQLKRVISSALKCLFPQHVKLNCFISRLGITGISIGSREKCLQNGGDCGKHEKAHSEHKHAQSTGAEKHSKTRHQSRGYSRSCYYDP